jgi:hypothetical protein
MLRRMALVVTAASEERIASIIRVVTTGELGITLALPYNDIPLPQSYRCYSDTLVPAINEYGNEEWCLLGCYVVWLL